MPKYNFEETKAFHVDYSEIEFIIKETYGIAYEIPCQEEKGNDEDWSVSFKKETISKHNLDDLTDFKNGKNPSFVLYTIMQDMVNNDIIPEGNYVVSISW